MADGTEFDDALLGLPRFRVVAVIEDGSPDIRVRRIASAILLEASSHGMVHDLT
jgi:hypothetical protein